VPLTTSAESKKPVPSAGVHASAGPVVSSVTVTAVEAGESPA
jgi:hypothetical protein